MFMLQGGIFFFFASLVACASGRSVGPTGAQETGSVGRAEDFVMCGFPGCHYDLQLFCLSNGVIVMGSCSLKNTLCTNGERNSLHIADGWDTCFEASYTLPHGHEMVVVHHNNSGTASSGQQTAAVSEDAVDEVQEQSLTAAETQPGTGLHASGAADRQREGASPVQERQEHKEKHPQMESVRKTQNVGTPKDADADMMALEEELENAFGRTQDGSNDPFHSDGNPISSGKILKTSA